MGRVKRAVRRSVVLGSSLAILVGYAALDAADIVPGVLTTRPLPPPPPTATTGTRTLPLVSQPSPLASARMPLSSLAADAEAPSAAGIRDELGPVLALPALASASLVVRDGQTGDVLLDQRGAVPQVPASTTKLLSAAAIAQVFGPDDTLTTKVVQGGSPGSIVLVAGGDSLLAPAKGDTNAVAGRAGLGDLAAQVARALRSSGTTKVTVSVDQAYAPGPLVAPTWSPSFRPDGLTGAVAMLGRSDQRALPGRPGPADPVASTLDDFVAQLRKQGVSASTATATTSTRSATAPHAVVLGSVESAPVLDQLALALTDSDNALIEILARQAAYRSGAKTSFADVGAWVVKRVAALGLDTDGVTLSDASGLSRQNRVTALLLTDLLTKAYDGQHPTLRLAVEGMPIAGLTGTLEDRFLSGASRAAAGRVRAKTGTLTGANALAGSVVDDNGRLLVFAGLVPNAPTADARDALDRFVTTLAGCGCR